MRLLLFILFFFVKSISAQTYYVSNAGSDAASGLIGNPFQTITHALTVLGSGDSLLLNKGNTWNEKLTVPASNIYFGSYGTGAKPILTGFQSVTGFTNSGNIWSTTFTNSVKYLNSVLIGDSLRAKGRFPNTTWLTFTSHVGKTQLTGSLTGTPDYTGAQLVTKSRQWVADVVYITSQSGGTLNLSPEVSYELQNGWGYFIQNIESVLDIQNEWCYDSLTKVLKVYSTTSPTVKASSIDTLIYINTKNNIKIDGLRIDGANLQGIAVDSSDNVTVTNCDFRNIGQNGILALRSVDYFTATNNTFRNIQSNAILGAWSGIGNDLGANDYAVITGNDLSYIGDVIGMGKSNVDAYEGINWYGDRSTISNNVIDTVGYMGIRFSGDSCLIKNNLIDRYCFVKQDGGAIYTFQTGAYVLKTGSRVLANITLNGIGAAAGTSSSSTSVYSLYMDGSVYGVSIDSNTVSAAANSGILINEARAINIRGNTLVNNAATQIFYVGQNPNLAGLMNVTGNVLYSGIAVPQFGNMPLFNGDTYYISFANFGVMDSNFYSRPPNESHVSKWATSGTQYSLAGWRTASGKDMNTVQTPAGITAAAPLFKYNATSTAVVEPLTGTYISARGVTYTNSVIIQPFRSEVLFKAINDIVPSTRLSSLKFRKVQ